MALLTGISGPQQLLPPPKDIPAIPKPQIPPAPSPKSTIIRVLGNDSASGPGARMSNGPAVADTSVSVAAISKHVTDLQGPLNAMRNATQTLLGTNGNPIDKAITLRDAISLGIVNSLAQYTAAVGNGGFGAPGPPGPPGGSVTPDLTPPPDVTGLVANGGFANIIVQFDAATYTQGHGQQKTNIYAVKKLNTDLTQPTFTDAAIVFEAEGPLTIVALPSDLAIRWHIWAKYETNDGVESLNPAGGVHGIIAQTGLIGGVDLSDLIIEARHLADGSVSATKLAAHAVELTAFANGIEPVGIVSALPNLVGYTGPKTVLLTTDTKLYRFNGLGWTKATDGADIVANSITAGAIAAGAISATQIAAGAITTDKLFITGRGAALNDDPSTSDITAWTVRSGTLSIATVTDGIAGASALLLGSGVTEVRSRIVPCVPGKTYRAAMYARAVSGSGTAFLRIYMFNNAGTLVAFQTGNEAVPLTTSWTRYKGTLLAPPTVTTMWLDVISGYPSGGVVAQVQDARLEEAVGYDLIVDGSILATHLAANSIAVGSAAIENGAITRAMLGLAIIDDARIANLSAAKLTAGDGTIGGTLKSANYTPGSLGWAIQPNGGAEFSFAMIRGTLAASQVSAGLITATMIDSRNLTIKDSAGNVIFGAGTGLDYSSIGGNKPAAGSTADINLIGKGSALTINGNTITKTAAAGWDCGAYSAQGYSKGAFAEYIVYSSDVMGGLNTDPPNGADFVGLDYALHPSSNGNLYAYESGAGTVLASSWATGDALAVTYDEVNVRYFQNGVLRRTVAAAAGLKFYFDSSLYTPGSALKNIRFGPMSSNDFSAVGGSTRPANNATVGAQFGVNISGQITAFNVSTYIAAAAIQAAQIGVLLAGNLTVGAISNTINGGSTSGARMEFALSKQTVYDASNVKRVQIGDLS